MAHPTEPAGRGVGAARLPELAGAAGVLLMIAIGLLVGDRVPGVDRWGLDVLTLADGPAETVAEVASDGLRLAAVAAGAAAIGWLVRRGGRRALAPALGFAGVFVLATASSELLKDVFGRPHPTDPADVSYPSTHVVMVTVAAAIAVAILGGSAGRRLSWLVAAATVAVIATAATRVLLGEHHVTDVAGTALGYAGLALLVLVPLRAWAVRRSPRAPLPRSTP